MSKFVFRYAINVANQARRSVCTAVALALAATAAAQPAQQSTRTWTSVDFEEQNELVVATFLATPASAPMDSVIGLAPTPASSYNGLACIVRFAPSGVIDIRDGGSYKAENRVPYKAGETYSFTIVADIERRTYSVSVARIGSEPVAIAIDYNFRNEQAEATRLSAFSFRTSGADSVTLSDFSASDKPPAAQLKPAPDQLIALSWQDNSDNELGFEVERSKNQGPFAAIATLPENTTAFVDETVEPHTLYSYRVRAFNPFGYSSYTNAVEAWISEAPADPSISAIANISVAPGTNPSGIAFTVGSNETSASALTVTATSSNQNLVPQTGISISGTGILRSLNLTPASGQYGVSTISITVSDGVQETTSNFTINIQPSGKWIDIESFRIEAGIAIAEVSNQTEKSFTLWRMHELGNGPWTLVDTAEIFVDDETTVIMDPEPAQFPVYYRVMASGIDSLSDAGEGGGALVAAN